MNRPRVFSVLGDAIDAAALAEASRILRQGGLVAFPTETVYGLGADATNPKAIERLNQVKGRPPEKPYSLHLYTLEQMRPLIVSVPPAAAKLIERLWPGPLTIVIPGKDGATVGFRLPDHPIAHAFLKACGVPVVAPSANRSGLPPPTDAQEVLAALNGDVDCVLDGGPTRLGRESTVVEVMGDRVEIRREGAIPKERILSLS
ncbi:MAG: threonylcarbamoyl-AMP synthase [Candidatus Omnitrophica bacterium]|nr:threonylcarbamoyl-AMP synthase [Candidatus Omnitrophota bacterium]MBI3021581.1 threonylcarbamoyl-AMP synthase [Candidatus Omnitrophota bacterium]